MAARARTEIVRVDVARELPPELTEAHPFEIWISNTLRFGVGVSGVVLALGLLLFFARGHQAGEAASLHQLIHSTAANVGLMTIFRHAQRLHPSDVIRLGLLALILTPVVRVAMTAVLFVAQRDWLFLGIVLVVFGVLLVGLTGAVG